MYIGLPKPLQHRTCRLEPMKLDAALTEKKAKKFQGDPVVNMMVMSQPKDWYSVSVLCFNYLISNSLI